MATAATPSMAMALHLFSVFPANSPLPPRGGGGSVGSPFLKLSIATRKVERERERLPSFRLRTRSPPRAAASMVAESNTREANLERLEEWAKGNGVTSAGAVGCAVVAEGLGLVAKRDISRGEEVASVPQELWMSVSTAKNCNKIGKFCQNLRPWVSVALLLLFERTRPDSQWRLYIDTLPQTLTSPIFWSEEELVELQGTQLLGSALGYKDYVESEYNNLMETVLRPNPDVFDSSQFSKADFFWAFGILRSRTFPPLTGDDLALVPFADLVNHGVDLDVDEPSWTRKSSGLFSRQESLVLQAPVAVKAGKQVFMQYGKKKSNGQLALEYGFVDSNPENSAIRESFMLTLQIPETDRFYDDKLDVAEQNGLGSTVYFDISKEGPPDEMLAFLRLTALSGPDSFLLEALFRNSVWEHLMLPVSRENEEAICQAMLDGCRSALAGFTSSIEEDARLLNDEKLSPSLQVAITVRMGEKRVLKELQLWFEAQFGNLGQLKYYAERRLKSLGLLDDTGDLTPWVF